MLLAYIKFLTYGWRYYRFVNQKETLYALWTGYLKSEIEFFLKRADFISTVFYGVLKAKKFYVLYSCNWMKPSGWQKKFVFHFFIFKVETLIMSVHQSDTRDVGKLYFLNKWTFEQTKIKEIKSEHISGFLKLTIWTLRVFSHKNTIDFFFQFDKVSLQKNIVKTF